MQIMMAATCAFGLEAVLRRELEGLGIEDIRVSDGRCLFKGNMRLVARANLWLRTADRVYIIAGEAEGVESFEQLFQFVSSIEWEKWIPAEFNFPVLCSSNASVLHHEPSCQSIIKKAVVDRLKKVYKCTLTETGPRIKIVCSIRRNRVLLMLDTSGDGLFKRGYRKSGAKAPLKETLASALVLLSYWRKERFLIDPFCGSGTIAIEAALIGKNIAPGLLRSFDSKKWEVLSGKIWKEEENRCSELADRQTRLDIHASDIDHGMVEISILNAQQAGVSESIGFSVKDISDIWIDREYGIMITNPPYGKRLEDENRARELVKQLGMIFRKKSGWSSYILSPLADFERRFGRPADRRRKLYNGRIQVCYYQYRGRNPGSKE